MENAVEALKIAFGVLVFVMALTVAMVSFSNVKNASDVILYSKDETNYYEYQGVTGKAAENRIVGLETIIPTLYKYYKENYTVVFMQGDYDKVTGNFTNWQYLPVYNTPSNSSLWGNNGVKDSNGRTSYDRLMLKKYNVSSTTNKIFSFDLDEETLRHEPWTGSFNKAKENVDSFLKGTIYLNPNNNSKYIDYSEVPLGTGGFIAKYKNKKFVETISEYAYSGTQAQDSIYSDTDSSLLKEKNKRIIIFTYIRNN